MKERLINNLGLKILSVFLAFFVWLVVVNVSNPEVTRTKEVPLEIENEQVLLTANRTYEIGKNTVTVSYTVRTRDEYKVKASDFRAYIDLTELYDVTGSVPIKVEILSNKEVITSTAARPGVVRVKTEDLQRKRFELSVVPSGTPAPGFAINTATADPDYVYVDGPVSKVGLISSVGLEISVEGAAEDLIGSAEPVFYDANGNTLVPGELSDRVHVDTAQVNYVITLNKEKRLLLDFMVSGTAAPGYQYVGAECDVQSVAVNGLKTNLASLTKITVPATVLNVDGATEDKVVSVNLQSYLPEGVEIVQSESSTVNVLLKVEPLQTRTFRLLESDIQKNGATDNYLYRIQPRQIDVVLQGLGDDLGSLQLTDLAPRMDVASMEEGSYQGVLTFNRSDIFTIVSYTDFTMEVTPKINLETNTGGPGDHSQEATTADHETTEQEVGGDGTTEAESALNPTETPAAD